MAELIPLSHLLAMTPEMAKNDPAPSLLHFCLRYVKGRDQIEEDHLNLLRNALGITPDMLRHSGYKNK